MAGEEQQLGGSAKGSSRMTCFECLERQIHADLFGDVVFRYGLSDSAFPFGSAAVIEVNMNEGAERSKSEGTGAQLMLVKLAKLEDPLFHLDCSLIDNRLDNLFGKEGLPAEENDHLYAEFSSYGSDSKGSMVGQHISSTSFCPGCYIIRLVNCLSPVCHIGTGSYSVIKELVGKLLSGSMDDHVMSSLNLLFEGKTSEPYGARFLNLIGLPSFMEKYVSACVRHPNVAPILGVLKSNKYTNLLQLKAPYTLENIVHYSPSALRSDWHIRFLMYQLLSGLSHIHSLGFAHGNVRPSSIMLTDGYWSWLSVCEGYPGILSSKDSDPSINTCLCMEECHFQSIYADLNLSFSINWESDFNRWWIGELSNYEYLLILNKLAGRRWGDHTFHTVMPWVIDFSVMPDENSIAGWRDLKKSKWRLAKGDEQLDFTYSTSEVPHHVSDECLSELAVCSYKARRLPLSILCSAVRAVYEPNEYPSNMQRLYQWTPDECIPEFYSDPRIFHSLHAGMSDLSVPSWAKSSEDFILLHRKALESDRVSRELHHWIDITFGHKLYGDASILAKNVMLSTSDPVMPKATGRRQLFTKPHPMRRHSVKTALPNSKELQIGNQMPAMGNCSSMGSRGKPGINKCPDQEDAVLDIRYLLELEEAASFCEHARFLDPRYHFEENLMKDMVTGQQLDEEPIVGVLKEDDTENSLLAVPDTALTSFLESFDVDENGSTCYQEMLHWGQRLSASHISSKHTAGDMFSVGCILAELYLKSPLFDSVSLTAYSKSDVLPGHIEELPPHARMLVEFCIMKDWRRRPSAKSILESPYFPPTIRSVYHFVAPLQLLSKASARLQYAVKLAREGSLKSMGPFSAEMCAPYCLALLTTRSCDTETESALFLLKELLKCLKSQGTKRLVFPTIRKILQGEDFPHLKISLLQDSFVREVWEHLGKQVYLEKMQPLIISNLCNSPSKISASAASVLVIGSSEELGLPITIHQTILPLMHCFGKGLSADGIDALVRIGGLLGETVITRHLFPLLKNVVLSCINASHLHKSEPIQSWHSLALFDCFTALNGLVKLLPKEVVLKELILDQLCLHVMILMQTHLDISVIQIAATALIAVCQHIGADFTSVYILPQLKELFDELAFSQDSSGSHSSGRNLKVLLPKFDNEVHIKSRSDLVLLLYPSFASLIGIEKLRQCCSTWFLMEQFLERCHNLKLEFVGETSRSDVVENTNIQRSASLGGSSLDFSPAKLLLNGVGWSIPQSQGPKVGKNSVYYKQQDFQQGTAITKILPSSCHGMHDPWFWFPSTAASWDIADFHGRAGGHKDELPWKIKASVLCSARAHPGAVRTLAACHDECFVFTGGVGPGFKGTIQKWELPRMSCVSGYYGHDEVVNDICILSVSGRIASSDGTIHIWSSLTGKLISSFAESSSSFPYLLNPLSASKVNNDPTQGLTSNSSSGIYSNAFSGSMYTCMHYLDFNGKLVAGMGNGSIRFIDVSKNKKLHLWKTDTVENSLSSLVSAVCSCESDKTQAERAGYSPQWLAVGLSSGHCRLLDARCGEIIALWRAHDSYVTKLAAPEGHILVSSSLDRTLRIWDLRRSLSSQSNIFTGHSDGISSFAMWGQDLISISRNKIGLSSLSGSVVGGSARQQISPRELYSSDKGTRNLSLLSTISILPFSRLFIVGTEDGHLKICC